MTGDPNNISAELPAPRDDEPASLRSDIIDEITDHLQCAFHRELHSQASGGRESTDSDPTTAARERVLFRFGNPSTIARRLWYDAMKERIMSQRIATGAAVVAAVTSLGMFIVVWQALSANREMLQQSQQMNSQLMQQMQGLAATMSSRGTEEEAPAEWNRLQIQCVTETENGPPMAGVSICLQSAPENAVGNPPATMTSDTNGLVDFGRVHYGQYDVELTAPNGMRLESEISVRPGHDALETIVCPTGELAEARIAPDLQGATPPESLSGRIWYQFSVMRGSPPGRWNPESDGRNPEIDYWFVAPDGRWLVLNDDDGRRRVSTVNGPMAADVVTAPVGPLGGVTTAVWTLPEDVALNETVQVRPGSYLAGSTSVCIADDNDPTGRTLWEMLVPDDSKQGSFSPDKPGVVVVYGESNELSLPVPVPTLDMLEHVLQSAPEMEVVKLQIGGRLTDRFGRNILPARGDTHLYRSRVALYLTSPRSGFGGGQRLPGERPSRNPLLTGVEVISYWDPSQYGPFGGRELRVLLTPEEQTFLETIDQTVFATVVDQATERTNLDPAVKAELEERYGPGPAESPAGG